MDGGLPASFYNLQELLDIQREAPGVEAGRSQAESLMEAIAPGWKAHTADLDSRIDQSMAETIDRRLSSIERYGHGEMKPKLVAHWLKLGGATPAPVRAFDWPS
ncbi:hypothetical protein GSU69_02800 [Rathayibacter festucae]|uniref:DUF222 domain-containing protein n=1 Tax=Rathayibacter festucae TaxID=110937 RepID=A0ABX6GW27_9MICO|nr:hypothetical protein [Rathayibacter festucae]QHC61729.1 hypothetical protein GSU69_02800 [Rathayibacter festucae]